MNQNQIQAQDVEDSNEMYYCLKCDQMHRRLSSIGSWHESIERPEIEETGFRAPRSKPAPAPFAAGVALGMVLCESGMTEVRVSMVEDVWEAEGFDERFEMSADDALHALHNEYGAVIRDFHSGDEWVTFEADHTLYFKNSAQEYARRGMSQGVRHDPDW